MVTGFLCPAEPPPAIEPVALACGNHEIGERYRRAALPDGWLETADGTWQHRQPAAPVTA